VFPFQGALVEQAERVARLGAHHQLNWSELNWIRLDQIDLMLVIVLLTYRSVIAAHMEQQKELPSERCNECKLPAAHWASVFQLLQLVSPTQTETDCSQLNLLLLLARDCEQCGKLHTWFDTYICTTSSSCGPRFVLMCRSLVISDAFKWPAMATL